jgi:hypothetical protein
MSLGNGQCVLLAHEAGEESVVPPLPVFKRNPNVDIAPRLAGCTRSQRLTHLPAVDAHPARVRCRLTSTRTQRSVRGWCLRHSHPPCHTVPSVAEPTFKSRPSRYDGCG